MPQLSFPGDTDANQIPIFLTFYWGDYSKYNKDRNPDVIIGKKNWISVPYPKLFNIGNDVPYSHSGSIAGGPLDNLKMGFDNLTVGLNRMYDYFFRGGSSFTYDNMESVLSPGARRKYQVSMDLVAKSATQATRAKEIADTFQQNAFSSWSGGNRLLWKHPPLWILKTNQPGWDPIGLPSVLTHVDINRNPILDSPINLPNNYPLAVNINLSFLELEPAVNTTAGLKNRAWTFG